MSSGSTSVSSTIIVMIKARWQHLCHVIFLLDYVGVGYSRAHAITRLTNKIDSFFQKMNCIKGVYMNENAKWQ